MSKGLREIRSWPRASWGKNIQELSTRKGQCNGPAVRTRAWHVSETAWRPCGYSRGKEIERKEMMSERYGYPIVQGFPGHPLPGFWIYSE